MKERIACFCRLGAMELSAIPSRDFPTRKALAERVENHAINIPVGNPEEWYNDVLAYLRNHHDAIVRYNDGRGDMYYFYVKRMTARTMPFIRIVEVDTSHLWMIDEEYGIEDVVYLEPGDSNQVTRRER